MATADVSSLGDKKDDKGKDPPGGEDGSMTLWEHLDELRGRIVRMLIAFVIGAVICWLYKEAILDWLKVPFNGAWLDVSPKSRPTLHFGTPGALFFAYVHLSALSGFIVALPIVLYQLWAFVAPGLYSREKHYAIPFVASSCALFVGGGYFGWKWAFPAAFRFLLGFADENTVPTIMIGDYLDFCTRMFLAFGATAELPILTTFLAIAGLITHQHLIKFFRYFVVIAFVISAVVTPPDPLSQIMLAIPLIGLYGVSILVAWAITTSKRAKAPAAAEPEKKP